MSSIFPADAVAAILAFFPEETFKATSTELQAGFREVATKSPQLIGHISFGKIGAYVSSPAIDAALDSLAASGFYSRYNKDLVTYELNRDKLLSYYKAFLETRFDEAGVSVEDIKSASQLLKDTLHEIHESPNRHLLMVL